MGRGAQACKLMKKGAFPVKNTERNKDYRKNLSVENFATAPASQSLLKISEEGLPLRSTPGPERSANL